VERAADIGVSLTDVSAGGAKVVLSAPTMLDHQLELTVDRGKFRVLTNIRALVRWCRPVDDGRFAAGLRFERRLTPIELAGLV
jgi:hypothetical protein